MPGAFDGPTLILPAFRRPGFTSEALLPKVTSGSCMLPALIRELEVHSCGSGRAASGDRQAFTIIHQEPQILVALGSYQGLKLLLVSAHAPPAVSAAAALQEWWLHLATVLHRTPAACIPVMFLDANATFRKGPSTAETLQSEPICCNAQHLRDFARKHGLALSPQALPSGEPLYSWTSPQGHRKLIDYVGVPAEWLAACEAQPSPSLGDLYEDIDHQPVLMRICTTACAAPLQHRNRIDTRLWATTDGARLAQGVTASCRPITWASCATDHIDQLQRHLYQGLTDGKPVLPPRPRNPALTAATLAMVREQRHLRRCTRHAQCTATRAFLHLFLRAWQSHGQVDDSLCALNIDAASGRRPAGPCSMDRARSCARLCGRIRRRIPAT